MTSGFLQLESRLFTIECGKLKLTQVAKNHFAFATAFLWH
jgi:hypothetical protein